MEWYCLLLSSQTEPLQDVDGQQNHESQSLDSMIWPEKENSAKPYNYPFGYIRFSQKISLPKNWETKAYH